MVTIGSLALPILLSAVIVFIASAVLHMVLPVHRSDVSRLPDEEPVLEALRRSGVTPDDYVFPYCEPSQLKEPEAQARFERGPVGTMTVRPSGIPSLGKTLTVWFVYLLVIGVFTAYVTGRVLAPGAEYLRVFRIAGTVAFLAYAGAEPHQSIWWGRKWSTTIKNVVDSLIYGLLTAGVFGWLWPGV